jgi:hypothetical protein
MKFFKHSLTNEELRTLAIACGGVAFLIALAVWIAPGSDVLITTTPEHVLAAEDSGTHGNCRGSTVYNPQPGCPRINPPVVETYNAQGITPTTARLLGAAGGMSLSTAFRFGTSPNSCQNLGQPVSAILGDGGAGGGIYLHDLSGLAPNTTYYFCIYASNPAGADYGAVLSFKTLSVKPEVVTGPQTNVTPNLSDFYRHRRRKWHPDGCLLSLQHRLLA